MRIPLEVKVFWGKADIHSVIHFVGSYALMFTIWAVTGNPFEALWTTICYGVVWELLDLINYNLDQGGYYTPFEWLDKRGADVKDILFDIGGAVLAYGMIRMFV